MSFRLMVLAVFPVFLSSFSLAQDGKSPAAAPSNIAVVNLKAESGSDESLANLMSDIFRTALYDTGRFAVMNREDMDSILKEIKFQQSGACDATACIVEMGQALGVDRMVTGSVGVLGSSYVVNGKLINVKTSKNEILATETFPKDHTEDVKLVFNIIARTLAGLPVAKEKEQLEASTRRAAMEQPRVVSGARHPRPLRRLAFGPILGFGFQGSDRYRNETHNINGTGGLPGVMYGGQIEYRLAPTLVLLGKGTFGKNKVKFEIQDASVPHSEFSGTSASQSFSLALRLIPGTGNVRFYFGGGLAICHYTLTARGGPIDDLMDETYILPEAELGISIALSPKARMHLGSSWGANSQIQLIRLLQMQVSLGVL